MNKLWAANQSNLLLYYLPTRALKPTLSPYQFSTGDVKPVDLSWARTMFCDCTLSIPKADIYSGKISMQSADACHLGFDRRRNCHFVFVESLQRLTSANVSEWREDSFILCKRISSDTPVEYFEGFDLPFSNATSQLIKHRYTVRGRRERGAALRDSRSYNILVLYHRERDDSLVTMLREMGHTVRSVDNQNAPSQDLTKAALQHNILDSITEFNFVSFPLLARKSHMWPLRGGGPWRLPQANPRVITFELGQRNTCLAQKLTPAA